MSEWIEQLPAPVRHAVAAFLGVYVTTIAVAILAANGVTEVPWSGTLVDGLNKAFVAAAGIVATLYVTPLTDAYGVGKVEVPPVEPEVAVVEEDHVPEEPFVEQPEGDV
jgi:hypothetical protein